MNDAVLRPSESDQNKQFNYALYHHIAHWAAYIAIMGGLLTMGFFLCLTPIPANRPHRQEQMWVITFILISSFMAAMFFTMGMYSYGKILTKELPEGYRKRITPYRPHLPTMASAVAAAIGLTVFDLLVLWRWQ